VECYFERRMDGTVDMLSSVIESAIILSLAFWVAGILVAMCLLMFDLANPPVGKV
jgi:type II secretory pathway component PulF